MIFKKPLTWILILSLLHFPLFAQTKVDKKAAQEAARIANIKTLIQGFGTGENALIEVKRKGSKKVKGYISEAKDDSFVVADTAAASSYEVRYAEVDSVKPWQVQSGGGPSNKKNIFWTTVLVVGITVAAIFAYKHCKKLEREGKTCPAYEETY
ncbi:MAG TPA: hypothetical protein VFZ34_09155 [Blastocatellia bacterium]|nr:hypothetical protein [Blastocatellia bacterium]